MDRAMMFWTGWVQWEGVFGAALFKSAEGTVKPSLVCLELPVL